MVKRIYSENDSIEIRRIITSGSSFVISIPKDWMKQNNIEKGDEMECKINKDKIVISNKRIENAK